MYRIDTKQESVIALHADGPITLRIDVEPHGYSFSHGGDKAQHHIGFLNSALLVRTRPCDSIMTGTHLALFASGVDNQGSLRPAHFRNLSWEGVRAGGP